jgi:alpha-D-ribose 1-methylphosphonate 5-triphosphate synthase subunit PhnH
MQLGLVDPIVDGQRVLRAVLEAMARPGRVLAVTGPVESPAPLDPATTAICLALIDLDTPLWLDAAAASPAVLEYVSFHCGAPLAAGPSTARFAVVADLASMPPLDAFEAGDDEEPERSATLIVQVGGFQTGVGRRLRGPGIQGEAWLGIPGLPAAFWDQLRHNHMCFPRGVDVILAAGHQIAALPRSTRVED